MKPAPFDYHRPATIDEAATLLAELDDAKVIAGGQSLAPLLNMRLSVFDHLVDIGRIDELGAIEQVDATLRIGATVTQAEAERSPVVATAAPLVAAALPHIGHFQIRNRGTVCGSIAHADAASELPAVALALDATIEAVSIRGRRRIPASEFFVGTWMTSLAEDELVAAVEFPVWPGRCGAAVDEVARRHGDFAIAGAAIAVELGDGDVVQRCAIGLFGLGTTPVRAETAEAGVIGTEAAELVPAVVGRTAVEGLADVPEDLNGSAEYRTRVGAVVVARALTAAMREARRG